MRHAEINTVATELRRELAGPDSEKLWRHLLEVDHYRAVLPVVRNRHREALAEFKRVALERLREAGITRSSTPTHHQLDAGPHAAPAFLVLRLEIESFYVFANILLDKLAVLLEFYFGKAQGVSLYSHTGLVKGLSGFIAAKGVTVPSTLPTFANRFERELAAFRDKAIMHSKSPRMDRGASVDSDGARLTVRLVEYSGDPRKPADPVGSPAEIDRESVPIDELLPQLQEYVDLVIDTLQSNPHLCALKKAVPEASE